MQRFYTVDCLESGYPVKYINPDTFQIETFLGPFDDPGEASQEFKACVGGAESCYVELSVLEEKVCDLSRLRSVQTQPL